MRIRALTVTVALLSGIVAANAQIKPLSSGQPSFNAPEMRRHGSGFRHPNRPHRHHRYRHGVLVGPAPRALYR